MNAQHDHLLDALSHLLGAIEHKDAAGAEAAMEQALALFAQTPSPGDDERLRPLMERCESAARAFHEALGVEVRGSATSVRAGHAYSTGGRRVEP